MMVKNRTSAYEPREDGSFVIRIPMFDTVGATSLFTTVDDLARWVHSVEAGSLAGGEFIEQMITPGTLANGQPLDYAFGLIVGTYRGLRTVGHSGGDAGYRADLVLFPEQRFAVAVLANLSTINPGQLARQVADMYLEGEFPSEEGKVRPSAGAALPEASAHTPSAEELALKAGFYRHPVSGVMRRLYIVDGALQVNVAPGYALVPLARDRFRVADLPVEVAFTVGQDGVTELHEIIGDGQPTIYRAVPAVTPSSEELAAYTGTYVSTELGTAYTILRDGDKLVWRRRKFPDTILTPTVADEFSADGRIQMAFTRDQENRVSGLTVTTGRVRGLQFTSE
jgi:hypothetical protein